MWLSFVLSLNSPSSLATWNFASEAWIYFPFFYKNEMQNKAWLEVKSKFPSLSSSNRYRLLKAKACLLATLAVGWLYVLGKGTGLTLKNVEFWYTVAKNLKKNHSVY